MFGCSYFACVLRVKSFVCVFTEVFWPKMIQLLSNKITPHFQRLPMSKVRPIIILHLCGAAFTVTKKSCNIISVYDVILLNLLKITETFCERNIYSY